MIQSDNSESGHHIHFRLRCTGPRLGEPKADVVDAKRWMTAPAISGKAPPVFICPAAPSEYSVWTIDLRVVLVEAPLPNVSQHFMKPPFIGALEAHLVRMPP